MSTVLAFRHAKTCTNVLEYDEFLKIISTFSVSTAECKRGFSALNDICTRECNRICIITCNAVWFINVNGPPLLRVEFDKYLHNGLKNTIQLRLKIEEIDCHNDCYQNISCLL